jgi:hypothetical protein
MDYAFVVGTLTFTHGSDTVAQNQNTIPLTAGLHTVEVQYDIVKPANEFSGYELTISPGRGFALVPEPGTCALIALGAMALLRRRVALPLAPSKLATKQKGMLRMCGRLALARWLLISLPPIFPLIASAPESALDTASPAP